MGTQAAAETRRSDLYKPRFSQLRIVPRLNVREQYKDIVELAETIRANPLGVIKALSGWREVNQFFITDGHRRYYALEYIFKTYGIDMEVPFQIEPKGGLTNQERVLNMFTHAEGEPLTPLEQAKGVQRLIEEYGMKEAHIAKRLGKSAAWINKLNMLNEAPEDLKEIIRGKNGVSLSATEAMKLMVKEKKTPGAINEFMDTFKSELEADTTPETLDRAAKKKTASIRPKDIKKKYADKKEENKIDSWAITKVFIRQMVDPPKGAKGAAIYLFLGKIMNNQVTVDDLKKTLI